MSVAVKPPRMTQLSWAETRTILQAHQDAIEKLYAHDNALKDAIGGTVVDGLLASPVSTLLSAGFWARLRWLLTGKVA